MLIGKNSGRYVCFIFWEVELFFWVFLYSFFFTEQILLFVPCISCLVSFCVCVCTGVGAEEVLDKSPSGKSQSQCCLSGWLIFQKHRDRNTSKNSYCHSGLREHSCTVNFLHSLGPCLSLAVFPSTMHLTPLSLSSNNCTMVIIILCRLFLCTK